MDNTIEEREWRSSPIVFYTGILVLYTATKSILALFNY